MLKYYKLVTSNDTSWIVENNINANKIFYDYTNSPIQNKSFNANTTYFTNRLRAVLSLPILSTHVIQNHEKEIRDLF